ncbi:MAG TPA: SDR family oxidoreductase [Burkholderiales bacterium]|nr:SDR family oxidoreductase [Burkholderiales bacterium]
MHKLAGKKVLVTAGAQGIGLAISERMIEAGAHLAVHYHSSATSAQALVTKAQARGLKACAVGADLTKQSEAQRLLQEVDRQLGGLDALVNNAGSLIARRTLETVDEAFWREVLDVNVTSMLWVTQAALPLLCRNPQSSIVNMASLAGRKGGHAGSLVYSTAKGAILTWTRSLCAELGARGVRVNAVAPGLILGTAFHNTHTSDASAKATIAAIPLARAGAADDVARAVVYLASEYDGFITGATLDVNGGIYAA